MSSACGLKNDENENHVLENRDKNAAAGIHKRKEICRGTNQRERGCHQKEKTLRARERGGRLSAGKGGGGPLSFELENFEAAGDPQGCLRRAC